MRHHRTEQSKTSSIFLQVWKAPHNRTEGIFHQVWEVEQNRANKDFSSGLWGTTEQNRTKQKGFFYQVWEVPQNRIEQTRRIFQEWSTVTQFVRYYTEEQSTHERHFPGGLQDTKDYSRKNNSCWGELNETVFIQQNMRVISVRDKNGK